MRSAAEAKPVNSPHPVRGNGVIESEFKSFKIYEFQFPATPPPPPTPPKSIFKITPKSDLEKRLQKLRKTVPQGSPNGPQWRPESAHFRKKCVIKRS